MSRGGRTHGQARLPVESCHSLSAWGYFQRAQMWTDAEDDESDFAWDGDDKRAVIRFTRNGREHTQEIALVTTPCHYGGVRVWFRCKCGRRVGKVYLPCTFYFGDRLRVWWFACRHCFGLTYLQRRERAPYWSALHRADRIQARWLDRKGVHSQTIVRRVKQCNRLIERADASAIASIAGLAKRFGLELPAR